MFGFGKKKKAPNSHEQKDRQVSAPSAGIKGSLIPLEQRLMFDAAASATASEVATEQVAQEQAEAAVSSDSAGSDGQTADQAESQGVLEAIATYNPGESRSEVVFVDPTVPNYQELLAGMDPHIEVVMLDGGTDGMHQMASVLEGRTGIDVIHIISHGSAGELHLGTGTLSTESMSNQYAQDLATIQTALSEQADILVYGCDFAEGDAGQMAVDTLAQLTGADVEASTDVTGSFSLGGDWDFEVKTGSIETSLAISYDAQMNWHEVLGKESVSDTFSAKSYGNNDGTRSWSSNWSEVDAGSSGTNGGHINVNSGQLRIDTVAAGESVSRGVDLSGAKSATLSFDYTNSMSKSGSVEVRVSTDGGANYRTLSDGTFSRSSHAGSGTASFDLSGSMSANTKIQFLVAGSSGGDRLTLDNVKVDYNVADANKGEVKSQTDKGEVKGQSEKGEVKGQGDKGDTKGQTDKGAVKASSEKGEVKGQTEKGGVKGQSDKADVKGQSDKDEVKGQVDKGDVKGQSEKGDVKGQSEKGDVKAQTDKGEVKGQTPPVVAPVAVAADPVSVINPVVEVAMDPVPAVDPVMSEPVAVAVDPVSVMDPVVTEPVLEVAMDPVSGVDPVMPEPVEEVAIDPVLVVDPVMPEPVVEVAMEPDPVVVDPGMSESVEVAADPVPVVDPVMSDLVVEVAVDPGPVIDPVVPEPVEVAGGPAPIIDPVMTEPVVEVAVEPDPIVVDPGVTEPVVEVAMDPVPVVEVAMDPAPLVEMTVGPTPAMEMTVEPEPFVEITAGPGPVANPVVTEQLGVAPNVNVGNVKMSSPAAEQTLVASFHQQPSAGPDLTSPLSSSQSPLSDFGVGRSDAVNTAGKMVDGQSEPVVTLDTTAPSKTSSPIDQKWIAEETAVSGKGGTLFGASGSKVGAADNHDYRGPQDQAQFAFRQVPWPPAEEAEKAPEDSGDLAMPMLAGLVGAALQGNMRKKEKMTTMQGDIPAGEQQTANAQASQESSSDDDKEAPPRAA